MRTTLRHTSGSHHLTSPERGLSWLRDGGWYRIRCGAVDVSVALQQLVSTDPGQRQVAVDALVAAGGDAVEPLVAALHDKGSDAYPDPVVAALQRIGEPAFAPLVRTIAAADSWPIVVRAGNALAELRMPDMNRHLAALRHENPNVRNRTVLAFEELGARALPYATALLPLLGDPDEYVQDRAREAFRKMGPDAVPVLRKIRRSTGEHRRHALTALAELGGWDALDGTDQSLVRRLVRVKLAHAVPEPMGLCGAWYALPTTDQAAVLDAFGLSDPEPVTMRLGEAAWHHDSHAFHAEPGARVYVTAGLDGWTLVFGDPSDYTPWQTAGTDVKHDVAALSRRFGAAHWYCVFEGCTGWCIAEDGKVVRYYDNEEPDRTIGPAHPAEAGYLLPHDPFDEDEPSGSGAVQSPDRERSDHGATPDECWADDIAERASVNPTTLGPRTRMTGHGVLALTAVGRRAGTTPGALPI